MESHRDAVKDAVLDAVAELVADRGVPGLSMAAVAKQAGIGRATLYKYYTGMEAVLQAWHGRQVHQHLALLEEAAGREGSPLQRLEAVLVASAYASVHAEPGDMAAVLHAGEHVRHAREQVRDLMARLIREAATAGEVRNDVPAAELGDFCLHAVGAAPAATGAARGRLVHLALDALRCQVPPVTHAPH